VLDDNINLVLTQGTEERMEIEGPQNQIPNITSNISNGLLTISNNGDCRWARDPGEKINVHLFFRDLHKIDYRGSGNITNTDTLRLDSLRFESAEGAGDISLTVDNRVTISYILLENAFITWHGKSNTCYMYTTERGKTDMRDFSVKSMWINYQGIDDAYVTVSDYLSVNINFKGNIYYKGNPIVEANYYNLGRAIRIP
jgi:hypothetical protein